LIHYIEIMLGITCR